MDAARPVRKISNSATAVQFVFRPSCSLCSHAPCPVPSPSSSSSSSSPAPALVIVDVNGVVHAALRFLKNVSLSFVHRRHRSERCWHRARLPSRLEVLHPLVIAAVRPAVLCPPVFFHLSSRPLAPLRFPGTLSHPSVIIAPTTVQVTIGGFLHPCLVSSCFDRHRFCARLSSTFSPPFIPGSRTFKAQFLLAITLSQRHRPAAHCRPRCL